MKFPDHGAVNAYTGFLMRKISAASFQRFSQGVGAHGLHPMHFGMLTIIGEEEPVSQHELGSRMGIDPSSMVGRMDVLDEHGLVERTRGAEDRRSYEIRLSPAGRELLAELREQAEELADEIFAPLTERERKELHELLVKVADHLDDV